MRWLARRLLVLFTDAEREACPPVIPPWCTEVFIKQLANGPDAAPDGGADAGGAAACEEDPAGCAAACEDAPPPLPPPPGPPPPRPPLPAHRRRERAVEKFLCANSDELRAAAKKSREAKLKDMSIRQRMRVLASRRFDKLAEADQHLYYAELVHVSAKSRGPTGAWVIGGCPAADGDDAKLADLPAIKKRAVVLQV